MYILPRCIEVPLEPTFNFVSVYACLSIPKVTCDLKEHPESQLVVSLPRPLQVSQLSRVWVHDEAATGGSGNGFCVPAAAPPRQRWDLPAPRPGPGPGPGSGVWGRVRQHAAHLRHPVLGPTGIPGIQKNKHLRTAYMLSMDVISWQNKMLKSVLQIETCPLS